MKKYLKDLAIQMEMEKKIDYEGVYEILRKEKYRTELQKIDKDFFEQIIEYMKEKKKVAESKDKEGTIFIGEVQKAKKQLENIYKIIKELYEKRESKIIQVALLDSRGENKMEYDAMLDEEKEFYNKILSLLDEFRENILVNVTNGKKPEINGKAEKKEEKVKKEEPKEIKKDENIKVVKFTSSIPKFIGEDMEDYGPYEEEEIASLPLKIAEVLISNNKAEEV
jgi:DNA replication initiation complex subunit (GINS family)